MKRLDMGDTRRRLHGTSAAGRARIAAIGIAAAACLVFLFCNDPKSCAVYPRCLFHWATGLWCPGCGTTRGLYEILHGRFLAGIAMNPFVFAVLPMLVLSFSGMYRRTEGKKADALILAMALVFAILRNIPCSPFSMLAPTGN